MDPMYSNSYQIRYAQQQEEINELRRQTDDLKKRVHYLKDNICQEAAEVGSIDSISQMTSRFNVQKQGTKPRVEIAKREVITEEELEHEMNEFELIPANRGEAESRQAVRIRGREHTFSAIADAHEGVQLRGQKLGSLVERTRQLKEAGEEFERAARKINETKKTTTFGSWFS